MSVFIEVEKDGNYIPVPACTQEPGKFPQTIRNTYPDGSEEDLYLYCLLDDSKAYIKRAPVLEPGQTLTNTQIIEYMENKNLMDGFVAALDPENSVTQMVVITPRSPEGIILKFTHRDSSKK